MNLPRSLGSATSATHFAPIAMTAEPPVAYPSVSHRNHWIRMVTHLESAGVPKTRVGSGPSPISAAM